MLKQRLLTALILIPIFMLLLFKLTSSAFYILTGFFVIGGAWEWSSFMEIKRLPQKLIYPSLVLLTLFIAYLFPITTILNLAFVWWCVAIYLIMRYPQGVTGWGNGLVVRGLMGLFVLVPCWLAVNYLRNSPHGIAILLVLFALIWGADSGAYFVGKKWGKHKLLPQVSPGKTWEGLSGALGVTVIITFFSLFIFKVPYIRWPVALCLALITVLFSIVGDLFESMLKRRVGLKDSGHLLPGHGGILDRIDSLTAAAPIFASGLLISHWI